VKLKKKNFGMRHYRTPAICCSYMWTTTEDKNDSLRDVTSCSLVDMQQNFRGSCCLHC